MPFANRAHSTKVDQFLDTIDKHLENVQYAFIMVAALVVAADDASFYYVDAWKEGDEENPARDRLCALITMARAKCEELAREIDGAFKVFADRATWFVCWTQNGDANAKVDEGVDEAMFVLRPGGRFIASVRDYDALVHTQRPHDEPRLLGTAPARRLVTQIWTWAADGRCYVLEHLILRESPSGDWSGRARRGRYRALLRAELEAAAQVAGLVGGRWLTPEESGFYQPIFIAGR